MTISLQSLSKDPSTIIPLLRVCGIHLKALSFEMKEMSRVWTFPLFISRFFKGNIDIADNSEW